MRGTIIASDLYGSGPAAQAITGGNNPDGATDKASTAGRPQPTTAHAAAWWVALVALLVGVRLVYERYGRE
jgi:hypothetical protein